MRSTLRQAQVICPVSNDLAKSIASFASISKAERFCVVPNVVDTSLFQPQTSTTKAPSSAFQWLHISSLDDDQKNISGLIRAIQLVRNQSDQFPLWYLIGQVQMDFQIILKISFNLVQELM